MLVRARARNSGSPRQLLEYFGTVDLAIPIAVWSTHHDAFQAAGQDVTDMSGAERALLSLLAVQAARVSTQPILFIDDKGKQARNQNIVARLTSHGTRSYLRSC